MLTKKENQVGNLIFKTKFKTNRKGGKQKSYSYFKTQDVVVGATTS